MLFGIILNCIIFFSFKISYKDSFVDTPFGKYDDLFIELFFERFKAIYANSGTLKFWLKIIVNNPL